MPAQRREPSTCAICRQPAASGATLCAPCRSALKRARDGTVSEAILPRRRQRRRPVGPATAPIPSEASVRAPSSPSKRGWIRGVWAAAIAGLLVTGGAWIVHTRGNAGTIAPRYAITAAESGVETVKAATAGGPSVAAPAERTLSAVPAEAPPARSVDPLTLPSSIAVPRVAQPVEAVPLEPASMPIAAPIVTAPPPAPVVVAQAPAPRAAPPDRWQRLADALARCPSDDLIARTLCQESLRLEHCEGSWGRVAACPARPERDYGN